MTCCANPTPLCIVHGADLTIEVPVVNIDGLAQDLTGATAYFTLKQTPDDTVATLTKVSTDNAQAEILNPPTDGKLRIYLTAADSLTLVPRQSYVYDVWVKLATGKQYQVVPPSCMSVEPNISVLP